MPIKKPLTDADAGWRAKAKKLCDEMCTDAYRISDRHPANKKNRKAKPYSVPVEVDILIECLNQNDEERAKAMFHRLATIGQVKGLV